MPIAVPRHRSEVLATEFLRDALAVDGLGVLELEAMARAAGLLRENQRITHAKLFKTAKKTLGIRSRRAGFGVHSHWLWQLPQQNKTSRKPVPEPDRRTTPEPRVPIPIVWFEGVASLDDRDPPSDVPRHRWRLFVDDCKRFVASDWAGRAAQLGWNAMSLFGCAPRRPLDYSGSAGLLWALNGGRLVQLHRDWAVIDVSVNRSERVFYRRNVDAAKITLPWRKRD
jgi:hypothetical protein